MAIVSLAFALIALACSSPQRQARQGLPGEQVIRVATFNVNYGLAGEPTTLDAIFASNADVICLQETTPRWEGYIRAAAIDRYPHLWFHHSRGAGGLTVISRFPIASAQAHPAPAPGWFPAGQVIVDADGTAIQFMVVHLRPPVSDSGSFVVGYFEADDIHLAEVGGHLAALDPDLPTIMLGDFNEDADGEAIEWLEDRGLPNTLPLFDPNADTWRWSTWLIDLADDLDHVLVDGRFTPIMARVDDVGQSDHLPVVVDLVIAPPGAEVSPVR